MTLAAKIDDGKRRVQQISYNGKIQDAEIWAPYGMSYNLPPDCVCIYAQIGGDSGNLIVLPDRSQDRVLNLKEGEVAFFNPLTKTRTIYRANGDMEIVTEGSKGDLNIIVKGDCNLGIAGAANITAPTTNWTGDFNLVGDMNVTGDIDSTKTVTASTDVKTGSISLKTHLHGGSLTAPTGSVTPTGAPI